MKARAIMQRAVLVALACTWALVVAGCYYHDLDLETVDHYTHYGRSHTEDLRFFHGNGSDD